MPQPHNFNPSTPPPLGKRRCPGCGLPMFLSHIVPSDEDSKEWQTFECASCAYAEMVIVQFRKRGIVWKHD